MSPDGKRRIAVREIVETLQNSGLLYKKIEELLPKQLGIRNKIRLFRAVDRNSAYTAIFVVSQKSRLLMKDVAKFEEIYTKMSAFFDHNFKYRILIIDAPLCSKAEKAFKQAGWKLV